MRLTLDIYSFDRDMTPYRSFSYPTPIQLQPESDATKTIAVGFLAQRLRAREHYDALKYESALYKILAIIGFIVQRHELDNDECISVRLNVLLPYGEYSNRHHLQALLQQHLQSFNFCGLPIQARLEQWSCVPEAYGLIKLVRAKHTIPTKTVTLMFGHRNTSCIVQERGSLNSYESTTTDLGFHQLVDRICQRTSIKNQHLLVGTLYQLEVLGKAISPKEPLIKRLCQSREAGNQVTEARVIANTIQDCTEEYWYILKSWLASELPLDTHTYIIGGGAAKHLESRLRPYFDGKDQYWCEEQHLNLQQTLRMSTLGLDPSNADALSIRLMDVYGLHQTLKVKRPKQVAYSA